MINILIYAPEDRYHGDVEQLLPHLQDVQAVQIDAALALLTATAIRRVFLLMSIDFLHWLLCDPDYDALYHLLGLYEREGLIIVVTLRECAWENTFRRSLGIPPEEPAIRAVLERYLHCGVPSSPWPRITTTREEKKHDEGPGGASQSVPRVL